MNSAPTHFEVKVLRQDGPQQASYWERHRVEYETDMNVISVLQKIAALVQDLDAVHEASDTEPAGRVWVLGAGGTDGATAHALRSRLDRREGDDFLERLSELVLWETRGVPAGHGRRTGRTGEHDHAQDPGAHAGRGGDARAD